MDKRFNQFAKGDTEKSAQSSLCVCYTRVSSKGQYDNNASIETQKKYCRKYAEENNLSIVAEFGGTYESAKNDERKEFQKMLSFVKRRKNIGYIIVYSYDRFSRSGPSGAFISHELKQRGIKVVSATQSVDHSDPSGGFMEGIYHLFSQFDNQLRRDKCMTGMKEKLMQGYWPFIPPTGYDNLNQGKTADQHKLVINKQGQLLKKAFEWKANKDWSLVKISEKLEAQGLSIAPKRLTDYFRNPFYCGFVVSKMIPGEMIDGKHPPLVSKNTFLQVHENLSKFNSGYTIEKEVEELPLKQFVKCNCCGTSMTGYLVKKKNLYYYKCNQKGCKKNRSQKVLHQKFESLLSEYTINPQLAPVLEEMMKYVLEKNINQSPTDTKAMKLNLSSLKKKLSKIEERFVLGEIDQELFMKYRDKMSSEIEQIEQKLSGDKIALSNLEKAVSKCMMMASELPLLWKKANFEGKRKLQYLVFPEGIRYDRQNDDYRTTRINLLFSGILYLSRLVEDYKKGDSIKIDQIPAWVGPPGLEPGTP